MKSLRMVRVFTDRYPLLGPTIWILSVQYFIVQFVVSLDWARPFSLRFNTISDLGNTACGQYSGRLVCSPLHGLMNASFIALGLIMASGALLIYQEFRETRLALAGFSMMALAGLGALLVGLFPENTIAGFHILGAGLTFTLGNLGLIVLGLALRNIPGWLRLFSVAAGSVALIALLFFISDVYGSLGSGGVERIVAYPQTVWLIVFGIYTSRNRSRV